MFLSRIRINHKRRSTIKFMSSLQVMHATVESCFERSDTTRKLWRLDYFKGDPYILILSENKPDFTSLVAQYGYDGDCGESKDYQKVLDILAEGQQYRFRFCGNPVHSVAMQNSRGRGKVLPHVTVAQQEDWLRQKSDKAGFSLGAFSVIMRDVKKFSRQGKTVTLSTAVFEGVLKVTDAKLFREALISGIGRAKSYGCGLLTLARV